MAKRTYHRFTEDTLRRIKAEYPGTSSQELADKWGISLSSLYTKMRRECVRKDKRFIKRHASARAIRRFANMTDEDKAHRQQKMSESMRKTWRSERRRALVFGLEQRTHLRIVKQERRKISFRHRLKVKGYITWIDRHTIYYTAETYRNINMEQRSDAYGLSVSILPEYMSVSAPPSKKRRSVNE